MVTAVELARRLRVNPKTLRAWLRGQARAGHPLLASHLHYGRWEFTEDEADQLAREYRGEEPLATSPRPRPTTPLHSEVEARRASPVHARGDPGHSVTARWLGEEVETLEDLLCPGLNAVCIGINPSPVSVAAGHYYQGRLGQRFWARLRKAGLLPDDATGFEDDVAFAAGIGFTDIVKRPTGSADELRPEDYEHGREALVENLERVDPGLLILTFKKTAVELCGSFSGYGFEPGLTVGGVECFVMPGPYERADRATVALAELRRRLAN